MTFRSVWQGQDKDMKVTSNDDGSTTIEILFVGPTQYYDNDGDKLFKDVGRTFVTIRVDEKGDFIEELDFDPRGRFETMDRDFCADVVEFIG
jgi:hypothetical protein